MGNRISNKQKQAKLSDHGEPPSSFVKKLTSRKMRRAALETEIDLTVGRNSTPGSVDHRAKRKRAGICPICMEKLQKNAKGTRYERVCRECGSVYRQKIICPSCGTRRVWTGKHGDWCKGCGKVVSRRTS